MRGKVEEEREIVTIYTEWMKNRNDEEKYQCNNLPNTESLPAHWKPVYQQTRVFASLCCVRFSLEAVEESRCVGSYISFFLSLSVFLVFLLTRLFVKWGGGFAVRIFFSSHTSQKERKRTYITKHGGEHE